MTHCPETKRLLEAGLDPSDHCETCAAVSKELAARHADLDRALDAFARAREAEPAVAAAMLHAAPTGQGPGSRRLHGVLIAVVLALVFGLLWAGGAPPTTPNQAMPVVEPTEDEAEPDEADRALVEETGPVPWDGLSTEEWGERAMALYEVAARAESEGDPLSDALRPFLFDTLAQTGRAAENANDVRAPHYQSVDGVMVNHAWYRAASLAVPDPDLLDRVEGGLRASVEHYLKRIEAGEIPPHYGPEAPTKPTPPTGDRMVDGARKMVADAARAPADRWTSDQWAQVARDLTGAAASLASERDPEDRTIRALIFQLHAQAGAATEHVDTPESPLVQQVGGSPINRGLYRAASMAHREPALLGEEHAEVDALRPLIGRIQGGELPAWDGP